MLERCVAGKSHIWLKSILYIHLWPLKSLKTLLGKLLILVASKGEKTVGAHTLSENQFSKAVENYIKKCNCLSSECVVPELSAVNCMNCVLDQGLTQCVVPVMSTVNCMNSILDQGLTQCVVPVMSTVNCMNSILDQGLTQCVVPVMSTVNCMNSILDQGLTQCVVPVMSTVNCMNSILDQGLTQCVVPVMSTVNCINSVLDQGYDIITEGLLKFVAQQWLFVCASMKKKGWKDVLCLVNLNLLRLLSLYLLSLTTHSHISLLSLYVSNHPFSYISIISICL